ncbi:MAG: heme exporter protein CcmD [Steroidobacteraceae bacterium]
MMSSSFWAMGGYARYVWPCYAFAGVVLAWNFWSAKRFRVAAQLRARRAAAMTMAAEDQS